MSSYARFKTFHMWVGLLVLIPIILSAATGFLWNHEKTLGLKNEYKDASADKTSAASEPILSTHDTWQQHESAVKEALAAARETWGKEIDLDRIELKQEHRHGLVVKVKATEDAEMVPEEIVWSVAERRIIAKKGDPSEGTDWAKVVHDLHTGKFFSRHFGFLWSDSGALAMLFLGGTGVIMYTLPILKKRANRRKRQQSPTAPLAHVSRRSTNQTVELVGAADETR